MEAYSRSKQVPQPPRFAALWCHVSISASCRLTFPLLSSVRPIVCLSLSFSLPLSLPQFKEWDIQFYSRAQYDNVELPAIAESEGLIRQSQQLCSALVEIIHSDVLSVRKRISTQGSSTRSTVGIMLTGGVVSETCDVHYLHLILSEFNFMKEVCMMFHFSFMKEVCMMFYERSLHDVFQVG